MFNAGLIMTSAAQQFLEEVCVCDYDEMLYAVDHYLQLGNFPVPITTDVFESYSFIRLKR